MSNESEAMTHFTEAEKERFKLLDGAIREGVQVFFIVGQALQEVRDNKLFIIEGFKSFEDYAQDRGYTSRYCNQLALSSEVVKGLPASMQKLLKNEAAARALARIPETLRPAVVEKAAKGKKVVTAKDVKKAAPTNLPPRRKEPTQKLPARKTKAEKKEEPKVLDHTGVEVPPEIMDVWNRGGEADELVVYIRATELKLKKIQESKDALYAECDITDDLAKIKQILQDLKRSVPFAVCPSCNGKLDTAKCKTCKGRGFVSEFYWTTLVPEETRNLRPKGWKGEA